MRFPDWLKKMGGVGSVTLIAGLIWQAGVWCTNTTRTLDNLNKSQSYIINSLDTIKSGNAVVHQKQTRQDERIDAISNNQHLMNRYVRAPQIPVPPPIENLPVHHDNGQSAIGDQELSKVNSKKQQTVSIPPPTPYAARVKLPQLAIE